MLHPFGVAGATLYGVSSSSPDDRFVFTKDAYMALVKKNRKEYVHRYFLDVLTPLFEELKSDAIAMKPCRREIIFTLPENFSMTKTEAVLCAYFIDLGYKPLIEHKKEGDPSTPSTITITIT
jgi:hypothetical protein